MNIFKGSHDEDVDIFVGTLFLLPQLGTKITITSNCLLCFSCYTADFACFTSFGSKNNM